MSKIKILEGGIWHAQERRLIAEVKRYPTLYDWCESYAYGECENEWIDVSKRLGLTVKSCQSKWAKIQQDYKEHLRKLARNDQTVSFSKFLDGSLDFLKSYINTHLSSIMNKTPPQEVELICANNYDTNMSIMKNTDKYISINEPCTDADPELVQKINNDKYCPEYILVDDTDNSNDISENKQMCNKMKLKKPKPQKKRGRTERKPVEKSRNPLKEREDDIVVLDDSLIENITDLNVEENMSVSSSLLQSSNQPELVKTSNKLSHNEFCLRKPTSYISDTSKISVGSKVSEKQPISHKNNCSKSSQKKKNTLGKIRKCTSEHDDSKSDDEIFQKNVGVGGDEQEEYVLVNSVKKSYRFDVTDKQHMFGRMTLKKRCERTRRSKRKRKNNDSNSTADSDDSNNCVVVEEDLNYDSNNEDPGEVSAENVRKTEACNDDKASKLHSCSTSVGTSCNIANDQNLAELTQIQNPNPVSPAVFIGITAQNNVICLTPYILADYNNMQAVPSDTSHGEGSSKETALKAQNVHSVYTSDNIIISNVKQERDNKVISIDPDETDMKIFFDDLADYVTGVYPLEKQMEIKSKICSLVNTSKNNPFSH